MQKRSIALTVATVIGSLAFATIGVSAAHAEATDETAAAIIDASLENLQTEPVSDELASELLDGVLAADEAGLIDQEIIDAVTEVINAEPAPDAGDGATTSPSEPDSVVDNPIVDDLLDERLEGDQERWDEIAPAWKAAFETIRADFETCRTEGESTSQCARTLGFSLQIAHAQAVLTDIDARIAELSQLPEAEQAAALAELEAERAAVEARLVRAEAKLLALPADAAPVRAESVTQVLAQVRERAAVTVGADRAALATQGGATQSGATPGNANSGSGNSGAGNAGVTPQQATPPVQQRPAQAAVPSSPQQNPGQSNRPANPGNSGNSKGNQNKGNSGQ